MALLIFLITLIALHDFILCVPNRKYNYEIDSSIEGIVFESNQMYSWSGSLKETCKGDQFLQTEVFAHNYIETLTLENFTMQPLIPDSQKFYDVINFNIRTSIKSSGRIPIRQPSVFLKNKYGEDIILDSFDRTFRITSNLGVMVTYHKTETGKKNFLEPGDHFSLSYDFGYYDGPTDSSIYIQCIQVLITYETVDKNHEVRPTNETITYETEQTEETTEETEPVTTSHEPSISTHESSPETQETNIIVTDNTLQDLSVELNMNNVISILLIIVFFFMILVISCLAFPSLFVYFRAVMTYSLLDDDCEVTDTNDKNILLFHNNKKKKTIIYITVCPNVDLIVDRAEDISKFAVLSEEKLSIHTRVHSAIRKVGFSLEGHWAPIPYERIDRNEIVIMLGRLVRMHELGFIHRDISILAFWYKVGNFNVSKNSREIEDIKIFNIDKMVDTSQKGIVEDETIKRTCKAPEIDREQTYYQSTDVWYFVNSFIEILSKFIDKDSLRKHYLCDSPETRSSFKDLLECLEIHTRID